MHAKHNIAINLSTIIINSQSQGFYQKKGKKKLGSLAKVIKFMMIFLILNKMTIIIVEIFGKMTGLWDHFIVIMLIQKNLYDLYIFNYNYFN